MWGTDGGSYPTKLEWALQEKTGGPQRYTGYYPPKSPAAAVGQTTFAILFSQTQLLVSTPGHLPRNTKPQLLVSPNDFSK